jgi:hypothetical protein
VRFLLPTPIGRTQLRVFWSQVSLVVGLLLGLLLLGLDGVPRTTAWLAALSTALIVALPGLLRPYLVQWPYRGWNYGARRVAGYLERYVTFVCFVTVMVTWSLGSPARTFERSPDRRSMWFPRGTQPASTYVSTDARSAPPEQSSWSDDFRRWARSAGHPSAVVLLPFMRLLRTVADERADAPTSSNIYTLY